MNNGEMMANYHKWFMVSAKLLIVRHWGKFYQSKLAKSLSKSDKDEVQDKFLASSLNGADKR
jgi:hypothetical protein